MNVLARIQYRIAQLPEGANWRAARNAIAWKLEDHNDMIWERAAATGLTEGEILEWGNGIGAAIWNAYAPKAVKPKITVFYNVCNWFKTPYRKIKRWFKVVVVIVGLSVAMGHSGSQKPPDWRAIGGNPVIHELDGRVQTNAVERPLKP